MIVEILVMIMTTVIDTETLAAILFAQSTLRGQGARSDPLP